MTKGRLLLLLVGFAGCVNAQAQVNCAGSGELPLICLIPFTTSVSVGSAASASAVSTAVAIDGSIGAQLTQLPLSASAAGSTVLIVHGEYKPYENLGPIFVDRPDSVGQGNLVLGFNFQQFTFNRLDGINLGSVPFAFQATQNGANQFISQSQHISFKYNQYVLLATYGLFKNADVTVVVPFARVSIGAAAINPVAYNLNSQNQIVSHLNISPTFTPGTASGPGDIYANLKVVLWSGGEAGRGSLAAGSVVRFPTGDALNYLGSGAYGVNIYALASYKRKLSPHAKIAYQWNTNSVLLNPSGPQSANRQLPGGVQFNAGADWGLLSGLTLSGDLIANQSTNASSISPGTVTFPSQDPTTANPVVLNTVTSGQNTYTTANLSAGLKWKPFRKAKLILYGNVLVQMNDVGLRPGPSPSGGISYSFK